MKVHRSLAAVACWLLMAVHGIGKEPVLIDAKSVDVAALLPPPAVSGSLQAIADMDAVIRAQKSRTDADVKRAQSENRLTPAAFQPVLGPTFTPERFQRIFELLAGAEQDSKFFTSKGKDYFGRPRPIDADSRVQPVVTTDHDRSYPSGHATRGAMWAAILSEIVPAKKALLVARGQEIGWDRVIAGVHYPSDVYAGQVLGQALAHSMLADKKFRDRLQTAKQEYASRILDLQSESAPKPERPQTQYDRQQLTQQIGSQESAR